MLVARAVEFVGDGADPKAGFLTGISGGLLERSMNTGPVLLLVGWALGNGGGDISGEPIGVGGIS